MFAAPPRIQAENFATLPDTLRLPHQQSAWVAGRPGPQAIDSLLEGPCFTKAGRFYCVDVAHGRIFEIDNGAFTVIADYDGEPNGLAAHPDGRIFVADYKRGIMVFDPVRRAVTPLVERYRADGFRGVNDLTFAMNGDLYFTDQGATGLHDATGRVFRLAVDGQLRVLLDNVPSPNGLVLNADETELYVGVTRDNAIWRVPLLADGGVAKVGRFIQMSGGVGPDGLAMDDAGNLLIAHVGLGCVWMFSPLGEPVLRIDSCAGKATTNIAFGGADNRTLYITEAESGTVMTAALDEPGRVLYSHARAPS